MKKKSQIRKYSVEKVSELSKSQTIPEMLKLYAEHAEEKKNKLQQKKQDLINQLDSIRKQSEKVAYQMVDGIKDRVEKASKVVMTAQSRPTSDDIRELSDLFTYMENQGSLMHRNSQETKQLHELIINISSGTNSHPADYSELDSKFAHLQAQCQREEIERDRLLRERNANRQFYASIEKTIDQYRVKYEIVEGLIAEREKYLDHLVSYFNTRQKQDQEKIEHELSVTNELQSELLKAQQILNTNSNKKMELQIRENEYTSRKLQES